MKDNNKLEDINNKIFACFAVVGGLVGIFYGNRLIKSQEKTFKESILKHDIQKVPAPMLQGMWQAYGQIRAARIAGSYALLASGAIGGAFLVYREASSYQIKKAQKDLDIAQKELNEREREIATREESANKGAENSLLIGFSAQAAQAKLAVADRHIRNLCGADEKCYTNYQQERDSAEQAVKKDIEEKRRRIVCGNNRF